MKEQTEIGNKLNALLEKSHDAQAGYISAQDQVKDMHLKSYLLGLANERENFGKELTAELTGMGQEAEKGTSLAGDTHRLWMNIKSTFSGNNDKAVVTEAIRGEKNAIEEYDEVIKEDTLPASTKDVLTHHRDTIRTAISNLEGLENTW